MNFGSVYSSTYGKASLNKLGNVASPWFAGVFITPRRPEGDAAFLSLIRLDFPEYDFGSVYRFQHFLQHVSLRWLQSRSFFRCSHTFVNTYLRDGVNQGAFSGAPALSSTRISEMASIKELFPVLWSLTTHIVGRVIWSSLIPSWLSFWTF